MVRHVCQANSKCSTGAGAADAWLGGFTCWLVGYVFKGAVAAAHHSSAPQAAGLCCRHSGSPISALSVDVRRSPVSCGSAFPRGDEGRAATARGRHPWHPPPGRAVWHERRGGATRGPPAASPPPSPRMGYKGRVRLPRAGPPSCPTMRCPRGEAGRDRPRSRAHRGRPQAGHPVYVPVGRPHPPVRRSHRRVRRI